MTSRARTQRQHASRIPTQPKKGTVIKKSKPISKSPVQPNNPLTQRVQTLEQQVSTLQSTINTLQSRLNKIESAVQVSNSGNVAINGTTVRVNASLVDVRAGTAKFSGVVQSDTIVTKSVVSESYTPGAGNIW
jgi:TolA-binding protein